MYLFTLFYDNILHIFNIADIWLHVKLIICTFLLCFCVKYILFLNLTTYLLVITIEEQFKVILYIQVSDAIAFCRLTTVNHIFSYYSLYFCDLVVCILY